MDKGQNLTWISCCCPLYTPKTPKKALDDQLNLNHLSKHKILVSSLVSPDLISFAFPLPFVSANERHSLMTRDQTFPDGCAACDAEHNMHVPAGRGNGKGGGRGVRRQSTVREAQVRFPATSTLRVLQQLRRCCLCSYI